MNTRSPELLSAMVDDLAYHQGRVLLLVRAVAAEPGNAGKLDGLTKLAKLDFLVRYPALAPVVLDELDAADPGLHLDDADLSEPTLVSDPMTRYKYGPWDDKYYPIIGALISRGLLRYARGRKGNVALVPTSLGRTLADDLAAEDVWRGIYDQCRTVAGASVGLTGNALKVRIYERLADLMDRPHREVIA
jgi:hypothetical protein